LGPTRAGLRAAALGAALFLARCSDVIAGARRLPGCDRQGEGREVPPARYVRVRVHVLGRPLVHSSARVELINAPNSATLGTSFGSECAP